jgi:hypothetical protein
VASGVGDGVIGGSDGETGIGVGDFFGDGAGDAFDFFLPDDAFAFFFFAGLAFSSVLASFSWATLLASDSAIRLDSAKFLRRLPASPQMKPARKRAWRRERSPLAATNKSE